MKKTNELIFALTNASDNPGAFLSFTSRHVSRYDILAKYLSDVYYLEGQK